MSAPGRDYWRSLEELAASPEFAALVEAELPRFGEALRGLERRRFLQLMAAPLALAGLSGCGPQADRRQLLPYVEQPPGIVSGRPRFYATATTRDGYAEGVLVRHHMARPVKVEGNPDHPASLGAASAQMQASILGLYDPRRAQSIVGQGQIATWETFAAALHQRRERLQRSGGEGLRLLTGPVTSPFLVAQLADLQRQFPAMRRHEWQPLHRDAELGAAERAFGRPLERLFDIAAADVILAIGSDLLSGAPGALAHARRFAARRRPAETGGDMSRVYAIESTPTLIGAKADHRLALTPAEIAAALRRIAGAVGAGPRDWADAGSPHAAWLAAAAQDLTAHRGRALVHAGREQPEEIHLLCDAINGALDAFGRTVRLIEPVAAAPGPQRQGIAELASDMNAGRVDTLVMLEVNPVYAAPADLDFAAALARVPLSVSLAAYADETALAAAWRIPAAHDYEIWADARAFDGSVTIRQPQVRPLYGGHSAHEVLAVLAGKDRSDDAAALRDFWRQRSEAAGTGDFGEFWREALRRGVVPDSAAAPVAATPRADIAAGLGPAPPHIAPGGGPLQLLFRGDDGVADGGLADNGWLQEMPRPFTRLTWDNAALLAPATAKRLGLDTRDVVEITAGGRTLAAPVFVLPGQAPGCVTLPLGFGRRAGGLGAGVGFDAYALRVAATPWQMEAAGLRGTGARLPLATVQGHDRMAGHDLVRELTLAEAVEGRRPDEAAKPSSLYPPHAYPEHAWAMAIDLNSCIGCQACVIACQAENNVPVVGKELVLQQRIMHWLRIDRYYSGLPDAPDIAFEPVPCMHCEQAPCEVVCPVHATVHDQEGLNLMVYNRCVGTRFCSNNCPYKVRRFNFFDYARETERPPESWNPEVSVRGRGVMEKCTYCIQRIRTADIDARRDGRPLADGDIVTACQQSCPTEAIVFGDRNDPDSAVARRKASRLDYVLLESLNTRPRTSYGALVRNPNPAIGREPS